MISSNQTTVLYKTRCPKCAEKGNDKHGDNFATYSDGHAYCFSCGYYLSGNPLSKIKNNTQRLSESKLLLPEDISTTLTEKATNWLLQYFERDDFPTTYYSNSKEQLIFPIYDDNVLIAFQARYFGSNPKYPKWYSNGINDSIIKLFKPIRSSSTTVILVEDLLSGYKVGKIQDTCVLFGSNLSIKRIQQLALLNYKNIVLWLDPDKRKESITFVQKCRAIGLESSTIFSEKDPKDYSYEEINELLVSNQKTI